MSKISYEESVKKLKNINIIPRVQKVFIVDSIGKILAQDIKASQNSPAHPTAAMDGYAVYMTSNKQNVYDLIDYSPAGTVVESAVSENTCIKTFTGSIMPNKSNTIIPIENVDVVENKVYIKEHVNIGFAVMPIGENYKKDEILIPKGTKIDFAEIGVMASLNLVFIEVYSSPTVAICSTGSEILDLGETQENISQIRSSNHITIQALAKKYDCVVNQLGIVKDDKKYILDTIKNGLNSSDIVITTGGVSVGDYDFVKDIVIGELNAEVIFRGVNIKPGRHIILARLGEKFILSLPGFAYSSTVTFVLYCLPLIFKFRGDNEKLHIIQCFAKNNISNQSDKTVFLACDLSFAHTSYYVDTCNKKNGTSAILTNLLGNSALAIIPSYTTYVQEDVLDVILV